MSSEHIATPVVEFEARISTQGDYWIIIIPKRHNAAITQLPPKAYYRVSLFPLNGATTEEN